jgi:hypothetical protein
MSKSESGPATVALLGIGGLLSIAYFVGASPLDALFYTAVPGLSAIVVFAHARKAEPPVAVAPSRLGLDGLMCGGSDLVLLRDNVGSTVALPRRRLLHRFLSACSGEPIDLHP